MVSQCAPIFESLIVRTVYNQVAAEYANTATGDGDRHGVDEAD